MELLGKEFFVILFDQHKIHGLKRGTNFPKRCPKFNKFLAILSTFRHQLVLHLNCQNFHQKVAKLD
jgi:hypothetical protein